MQDKTKNKIITIGFVAILILVFLINLISPDKNPSTTYLISLSLNSSFKLFLLIISIIFIITSFYSSLSLYVDLNKSFSELSSSKISILGNSSLLAKPK